MMLIDVNKVNVALARKGVTIADVCERSKLSKTTVYWGLKNGRISVRTAHALTTALDVDPAEIVPDGNEPKRRRCDEHR